MKKFVSIVLAVLMVMSLTVVALADNKVTGSGSNTMTKDADVALNGKITDDAVLMSVVMPTSIDFIINTKTENTVTYKDGKGSNNAPTSGHAFQGLISGTGTVTNNSNVAIKLEISNVTDNDGLLDKVNLAVASTEVNESTALQNPLEAKDYTGSEILLATSVAATNGTTELTVVGEGVNGTYSGTSYPVELANANYTVTTTLKISVAQ